MTDRHSQVGGIDWLVDGEGKLRVCTTEHSEDIARGNVTGAAVFSKLGYNGALSNAVEDLWTVGGEYVFPSSAMGMEIVSSSANDTADGSGVRTVVLGYLTTAFVEKSETITLSGTTPVPTVATDIYRVQHFRAATIGAGGKAAGNIDIRHLDDTPIYSRISTGETRALNITYTVPTGKRLCITDILPMCGSNVANRYVIFSTKATYNTLTATVTDFFMTYSQLIMQDNGISVPLHFPTMFPAGVSIKVSAISPEGATVGAVILRGWLETV